MTDPIAERIRKVGGTTLKSIGSIARAQRVLDNDAEYVEPLDMLAELREDNKELAARFREAHNVCDEHRDIATASLIEVWIDENRAAHLVPVRGEPQGRPHRPLSRPRPAAHEKSVCRIPGSLLRRAFSRGLCRRFRLGETGADLSRRGRIIDPARTESRQTQVDFAPFGMTLRLQGGKILAQDRANRIR